MSLNWRYLAALCMVAGTLAISLGCGGGSGSSGSNQPALTAPSIASQPSNATVNAGQGAQFTVTATGSAPLSYQWKKNDTDIPGATSATYTTPATGSTDNGSTFRVAVTNPAATVNSNGAMLNVLSPGLGQVYHVNATSGSDTTGDGTQIKPYQTIAKVWPALQAGDTVLLGSGLYPKFVAGRTGPDDQPWNQRAANVFTNWVTLKAESGQVPHIASLDLGTWSGSDGAAIPFTTLGQCDVFLRFEGLSIDDGVSIIACRYVEVKNCKIQRAGEISGSDDNLNRKTGVSVVNGRYITLEGNEITHAAFGIWGMTTDFAIRNNDIHHNSHDGISIHGGDRWLVEGNRIHDLDDGIDDSGTWGMHVDGIHAYFIAGSAKYATSLDGLIMRGNTFYHLEAMGVMVNASNPPATNYRNWVFENNVLGPVGGNLLHWGATIEGFTYRHNTMVYTPTTTWTSLYRTLNGPNYNVAWWPDGTGKRIYNNIFVDGTKSQPNLANASFALVACNLYKTAPYGSLERGAAIMTSLPYAEGDWTGALLTGSQAIDGGTRLGSNLLPMADQLNVDIQGKPRDNRPDIGAYEVQGRHPAPE
jgi:Right handed beta helix region/Immunoglobulin I-set domain